MDLISTEVHENQRKTPAARSRQGSNALTTIKKTKPIRRKLDSLKSSDDSVFVWTIEQHEIVPVLRYPLRLSNLKELFWHTGLGLQDHLSLTLQRSYLLSKVIYKSTLVSQRLIRSKELILLTFFKISSARTRPSQK